MGKKAKIGKSRRDKYYQLAKETGYRSRAAFKLLQLNRKFQFLEQSRVCIDLCAAPGGWLQVAAKHMPMSSLIVGVDLDPIKPIHNVASFIEDITTEKCRQRLKKELQTWKADVILHDGAPNLGKNWIHDAFQQAQLTLQALKLATEFLKKGGCFVTKVFRSKDYHALLWVFQQLFKKVHSTKPQASRSESAEIFVVCQFYKAPDKIDPKFLDLKHVFKDAQLEPKSAAINLIHPEKTKKKAVGYADEDYTLHHKILVSKFVQADNFLEVLADASEIVLDDEKIANHKFTSIEIKECCKDIKLLGKKELRALLNWRKKMKTFCSTLEKDGKSEQPVEEEMPSEDEEAEIDSQLAQMEEEKQKELKRKRKKVMKDKRKLRDQMELKMIHPGDCIETQVDIDMFDLKKIKSKKNLSAIQSEEMLEPSDEEEDSDDDESLNKKKAMVSFDRYEDSEDSSDEEKSLPTDNEESDLEMDSVGEQNEELNPLVVDMENKDDKTKRQMDMWFEKAAFVGIEDKDNEDLEIEKMTEAYRRKGGVVVGKKSMLGTKNRKSADENEDSDDTDEAEEDEDASEEDTDSDSDYNVQKSLAKRVRGEQLQKTNKSNKDGFEIVTAEPSKDPKKSKYLKLDPVELALGEELVKSSKRRRELEEESFNRYTFNDDNLPDWFYNDERKHNKPQLPITKEQVEAYKEKLKAINARPMKKVAQAKMRKKRKMDRKLENARKKSENISEALESSEGEKWKKIKEIYKKAGLTKKAKKELTYVVSKKSGGRSNPKKTKTKGPTRLVDTRMKKDKRNGRIKEKKQKAKKGGRRK